MRDFRDDVADYVRAKVPKGSPLLDLGAGYGDMAKRVFRDYAVDGVEVWEPYIEQYYLRALYRKLDVADATTYDVPGDKYAAIFALEIVEHLTVERAQEWLAYLATKTPLLIVSVPYLYPQGAVHGNEWQRHSQDDLTEELFAARYPQMKKLQKHYLHAGFWGGVWVHERA